MLTFLCNAVRIFAVDCAYYRWIQPQTAKVLDTFSLSELTWNSFRFTWSQQLHNAIGEKTHWTQYSASSCSNLYTLLGNEKSKPSWLSISAYWTFRLQNNQVRSLVHALRILGHPVLKAYFVSLIIQQTNQNRVVGRARKNGQFCFNRKTERLAMTSKQRHTLGRGQLSLLLLLLCSNQLTSAAFFKLDEIHILPASWHPLQTFYNVRLTFDKSK